ncbi:MAG: hypothetical protein HC859_16075 [Bacteroidia bacterium]|nr:hypothetical protein [Bacteroidia bacterium]
MRIRLHRLLGVDESETEPVALLLVMGFFMGMFIATVTVASQSLFLSRFDEKTDLPTALLISGAFGIAATVIYNFFQNRISFTFLAILSLVTITVLTGVLEFGEGYFGQGRIYYLAFTMLIPFGFINYLIFWGTFSRLFSLRQTKKLVGSVDSGGLIASLISFFSIPVILTYLDTADELYTISLVSIIGFLATFIFISLRYLRQAGGGRPEIVHQKVSLGQFFSNKYIVYMSLFVTVAMISINFVDYSFLNVTSLKFDDKALPTFLSAFEGTVVVFSFVFQTFATDRIISEYGLRVALIINPILIGVFTVISLLIGVQFGYTLETDSFIVFFLMIAMSKLVVRSLRDALDNPTFKLYLLPIESHVRIDVQTKIEGTITAFASLIAGG